MKYRFLRTLFTFGLVMSLNIPMVEAAHIDNPQSSDNTTIDMRATTDNFITLYWYDDTDQKNLLDTTQTIDLWADSVPRTDKVPTKEGYVFKEWFDVDSNMNLEMEDLTWSWLVVDKNGQGLANIGLLRDHCLHYIPVWEKLDEEPVITSSPTLLPEESIAPSSTPTATAMPTVEPTGTPVVKPTAIPDDNSEGSIVTTAVPDDIKQPFDQPTKTTEPRPEELIAETLPTDVPFSSLSPLNNTKVTPHPVIAGSENNQSISSPSALKTFAPVKTGVQNDVLPYAVFFGGCSILAIICGIIGRIIKKEAKKENNDFGNNENKKE